MKICNLKSVQLTLTPMRGALLWFFAFDKKNFKATYTWNSSLFVADASMKKNLKLWLYHFSEDFCFWSVKSPMH